MNAEHPPIDNSSESKIVEDFAAIPPDISRPIFSLAFIVKPVHLGDLPGLVVATYKCDTVGVADFICEEQEKRLNRVEAAINKVTHEKVVRLWAETSDFEELHHVPELAMYVTTYLLGKGQIQTTKGMVMEVFVREETYGNRGVHHLHVSLFDKNFTCFET